MMAKKNGAPTNAAPQAPAKGHIRTAQHMADAPFGARLKVLLLMFKSLSAPVGGFCESSSQRTRVVRIVVMAVVRPVFNPRK